MNAGIPTVGLVSTFMACAGWLAGCASGPAPARSDALFYRVHPGMTREEVRHLLGPQP